MTDMADFRDSALYRRITKYGTRGIIEVPSAEGQPVDPDAVQFLRPAGSEVPEELS